jgi:hypothetical protein
MLRQLRGAFKRCVGGFPHAVNIIVATHADVHHALNVATGETSLHPLGNARPLWVIQDVWFPCDYLQQHYAEAKHVTFDGELIC